MVARDGHIVEGAVHGDALPGGGVPARMLLVRIAAAAQAAAAVNVQELGGALIEVLFILARVIDVILFVAAVL